MAKEMTLAGIEALTKEFARARTEMMTVGEQLNIELQAVRDKHAEALRKRARLANALATQLYDAIDANRALFAAKGAKSKVFDGIKVGLQKGKATLAEAGGGEIDGEALYNRVSEIWPDDEVPTYVEVKYRPVIAALSGLDDDVLQMLALERVEGDDTPLVKPVDGEAAKVVDALIKEFIAE